MEDLAIDMKDRVENDEGWREPTISEVKPCPAEAIREVNRQKNLLPIISSFGIECSHLSLRFVSKFILDVSCKKKKRMSLRYLAQSHNIGNFWLWCLD